MPHFSVDYIFIIFNFSLNLRLGHPTVLFCIFVQNFGHNILSCLCPTCLLLPDYSPNMSNSRIEIVMFLIA